MRTGGLTESPSSPPHYLAPRADGLEKDRCHFEQSAAHLFAANRRRLSREPRECQCPEKVTTDIGYEKLSVSVSVKSHTNQRLRWTASTPLRRTRRISDTRQPPNSSPALMYTRTSGCEVGIVAVGMSAASRSLILGASNPRKICHGWCPVCATFFWKKRIETTKELVGEVDSTASRHARTVLPSRRSLLRPSSETVRGLRPKWCR